MKYLTEISISTKHNLLRVYDIPITKEDEQRYWCGIGNSYCKATDINIITHSEFFDVHVSVTTDNTSLVDDLKIQVVDVFKVKVKEQIKKLKCSLTFI